MADEAIFALTQETAMTAAMRLPLQETSAATRATSATFALLGGLEVESTYDTAADHADISAAAGKLYLVNMASLASDMNFTLPVAASIQTGERVGVFITTGDDTYEMDLKSGAASDLINGTDHSSTPWSRLFITGECVIFQCIDGSTADWSVVYDGRIPCQFSATLTASNTGLSGSSAFNQFNFDVGEIDIDIGDCGDATNDRFNLRRDGVYVVNGNAYLDDTDSGQAAILTIRYDDGVTDQVISRSSTYEPSNARAVGMSCSTIAELTVATHVNVYMETASTASTSYDLLVAATTINSFSVTEILSSR